MRAIIVGGGKVGYYILKTLKDKKFDVVLVEKDQSVCEKIAEEIDAEIICGDGSDMDVLIDAEIRKAEIVAAVTGKDEENLVICQMAKLNFDIKKTIARINNPKNRSIFRILGVDRTVCSTEVIANLIEGEFTNERLKTIQTLERGKAILVETNIERTDLCCGKIIQKLVLPEECVIVSILRDDKMVFPKGDTVIQEGDKILIITDADSKFEVGKCIIGRLKV